MSNSSNYSCINICDDQTVPIYGLCLSHLPYGEQHQNTTRGCVQPFIFNGSYCICAHGYLLHGEICINVLQNLLNLDDQMFMNISIINNQLDQIYKLIRFNNDNILQKLDNNISLIMNSIYQSEIASADKFVIVNSKIQSIDTTIINLTDNLKNQIVLNDKFNLEQDKRINYLQNNVSGIQVNINTEISRLQTQISQLKAQYNSLQNKYSIDCNGYTCTVCGTGGCGYFYNAGASQNGGN
ncbi:Hypothetical_protein [Hexamita inflata]|uniref:Hypothetical_protein n=1 Tax=Hexamita inflata TaxID=28002 RepID=A0AA86R7M0_9EUKA|nr:Hypothetical protein HINF_LOCUS55194 [Hexamita inflata]CAI9974397.1 Hypothetical protein HINF_LOCUS62042 [Hexamita inflata]